MMVTLPKPSGAFDWVQAPGGPALVCRSLEPFASHLFTTRDWRLGRRAGPDSDGWDEIAQSMGVEREYLVRMRQVHGSGVVIATGPAGHPPVDGDIVVGRDGALALAVQAADCVPLLLGDPKTGAVAAVHAGWRGLAGRAPEAAVRALARRFGANARDLVAAVGPAIGACCYEVGDDVFARFQEAQFGDQLDRWFTTEPRRSLANRPMAGVGLTSRRRRWFLDLWLAARDQVEACGVSAKRIHVAALCTASHEDAFCSFRRDGPSAGRMAGAIRSGQRRPWPRWPDGPHAR
jgi:hypothetical protein